MKSYNQKTTSNIYLKTVMMRFFEVERIKRKSIAKQNLGKRGIHCFQDDSDGKQYVWLKFACKVQNEIVKLNVALEKKYVDDPIQNFKRSFPFEKGSFYILTLRVSNRSESTNKGCIFFLHAYEEVSYFKAKENLKRTLFYERQTNPMIEIQNIKLIRFDFLFTNNREHNVVIKKFVKNKKAFYRIASIYNAKKPDYSLYLDKGLQQLLVSYNKSDIKRISDKSFVYDTKNRSKPINFTIDHDRIKQGYFLKVVS